MVFRIKEELLGKPCIALETVMQAKKNIATTRAFGKKLSDLDTISEAASTHAVRCPRNFASRKALLSFSLFLFIQTPFQKMKSMFTGQLLLPFLLLQIRTLNFQEQR